MGCVDGQLGAPLAYGLRLKHFHRLVQLMIWGFWSVTGVFSRHAAPPLLDKPELAFIGMGDASAGHNSCISRKGHAPTKALQKIVVNNYMAVSLDLPGARMCVS